VLRMTQCLAFYIFLGTMIRVATACESFTGANRMSDIARSLSLVSYCSMKCVFLIYKADRQIAVIVIGW